MEIEREEARYQGNFPTLEETTGQKLRERTPEWPKRTTGKRWYDILEMRGWKRDSPDHSEPIPMVSHYFSIINDGATSFLKRAC